MLADEKEPLGWLCRGRVWEMLFQARSDVVAVCGVLFAKWLDEKAIALYFKVFTQTKQVLSLALKILAAVLILRLDQLDGRAAILSPLSKESLEVIAGESLLSVLPAQVQVDLRQVNHSDPARVATRRQVFEVIIQCHRRAPFLLEPEGKDPGRGLLSATFSLALIALIIHRPPPDRTCGPKIHQNQILAHRFVRCPILIPES
jgi:hypothetical protein